MITNPIATSITIAVVLIAALRSLGEVSRTTVGNGDYSGLCDPFGDPLDPDTCP